MNTDTRSPEVHSIPVGWQVVLALLILMATGCANIRAATPIGAIQAPETIPSPTPTATPTPKPPSQITAGLTDNLPWVQKEPTPIPDSDLRISNISQNLTRVPLYEKFETSFNIFGSVATNHSFPFDPSPPEGLIGRIGISAEALILPPGVSDWNRAFVQPAFYYQPFESIRKGQGEGLAATGNPFWVIRIAPDQVGTWKYKLRIQDASLCPGNQDPCPNWLEADVRTFRAVTPSSTVHGPIQVSQTDPRYFEYANGTPFIGVGHQTAFGSTTQVQNLFDHYQANKVNLFRTWMSATGVYGLGFWFWDNWANSNLVFSPTFPGHDVSAEIRGVGDSPCIFQGFGEGAQSAFRANQSYTIEIRARLVGIDGPRSPGNPYGLVAKFGEWPKGICGQSGNSLRSLTPYWHNSAGWQTYRSTFSFSEDTIVGWDGNLTLALENTRDGFAYIDEVRIFETGGGPDTLVRGNMNYHLYFDQASSWRWDQILDSAADRNIFFKIVILEIQDPIFGSIEADGSMATEPTNDNFHGVHPTGGNRTTKVRRLHQYFWRYLAARWGYSRAVHSWELLNEGNPFNDNHYNQAEALGREIKRYGPNQHLVTTSFWHSYPVQEFWGNPAYPSVDYADFHAYVDTSWLSAPENILDGETLDRCGGNQNCYLNTLKDDSSLYHTEHSLNAVLDFPGKPTVRGEAGLTIPGTTQEPDPQIMDDQAGIWLHKYLFSQVNPGGLYDIYWFDQEIQANQLYPLFKRFQDFMANIPINNGNFMDADPLVLDTNRLRAYGQKDLDNRLAFLWVENRDHTWKRAVNNQDSPAEYGRIILEGFPPQVTLSVEWWHTCSGEPPQGCTVSIQRTESVTSDTNGNITLVVDDLSTDIAIKIGNFGN